IQRLDAALFIHAEDHRLRPRIPIEPDYVPQLFDKLGVAREFEPAHAMRLQAMLPPDLPNRAVAQPLGFGQSAEPTTTSDLARRRCSPRSTRKRARSSLKFISATGRSNFARFSIGLTLTFHAASPCIIMDNYRTHKTAVIHHWFAKLPRFHVHFT